MTLCLRDNILKIATSKAELAGAPRLKPKGELQRGFLYEVQEHNLQLLDRRIGGEGMSLNVFFAHSGALYQADPRSFTS